MNRVNKVINPAYGIVTALEVEYAAMMALLDNTITVSIPSSSVSVYTIGEIKALDGGIHSIVLALLVGMGNNLAAAQSVMLLNSFPTVHTLIMVGIAGGVPHPNSPSDHVRLGDVVVSSQQGVIQYDFIKESLFEITERHPPRPAKSLLVHLSKMISAQDMSVQKSWTAHIERARSKLNVELFKIPPPEMDVLYKTESQDEIAEHPTDERRFPGQPRLFIGPIASANSLQKNPVKRDYLRDKFKVKAIEMEGSGISDTTWLHGKEYFVVRGICDYADTHKNDIWQPYAAIVAASFTRAIMELAPSIEVHSDNMTPVNTHGSMNTSSDPHALGLSTRKVYSLDLYGDQQRLLDQMREWRLMANDPSADFNITSDHISIGSVNSWTFNIPPVDGLRNCRVECDIKIADNGGDPGNWAGIRVRGFNLDIGLGYLVYLRSSGQVELYSNREILSGKDTVIIENTRDYWTRIAIEINNHDISVFVNGKHYFTHRDERFYGRDLIFLHTHRAKALFKNFAVYSLDEIAI